MTMYTEDFDLLAEGPHNPDLTTPLVLIHNEVHLEVVAALPAWFPELTGRSIAAGGTNSTPPHPTVTTIVLAKPSVRVKISLNIYFADNPAGGIIFYDRRGNQLGVVTTDTGGKQVIEFEHEDGAYEDGIQIIKFATNKSVYLDNLVYVTRDEPTEQIKEELRALVGKGKYP